MSYCNRCELQYESQHILDQHVKDSDYHNICDKCNKDFKTGYGRTQHYIMSSRHFYCRQCEKHFGDNENLETHYDDHWYCRPCSKFFDSERGLEDHRRVKHWYCAPCKRLFQSEDNLRTHIQTSATHNEKRLPCPGLNCTKSFISYSDITIHLESGACRSGMDRRDINAIAARFDQSHVVTKPGLSITAPNTSSFAPPMIQAYATVRSFNGHDYECILCHKTFGSLSSLNLHLNSPVHDERIYHCPTEFSGCGTEFKTLSGLMRHAESGSCSVLCFLKSAPKLDGPTVRLIAPHAEQTEEEESIPADKDKSVGGFGEALGAIVWIILLAYLASWYFGLGEPKVAPS